MVAVSKTHFIMDYSEKSLSPSIYRFLNWKEMTVHEEHTSDAKIKAHLDADRNFE